MQKGTRIQEPYTLVEINVFWRKQKDGFNPQAGRGENTAGLCSRTESPPIGSQGDHTVRAYSHRLEIKSKHARILYSFFLHRFKTVNRLVSASPVTWVWQAVLGVGSIAFCGLHCGFLSIMQNEGQTNDKLSITQDVTSIKLKDNRCKVWLMQSQRAIGVGYPWRRVWQPTPVFLPGEFHGERSLVSYSPWDRRESDTTEQLTHTHTHTHTHTEVEDIAYITDQSSVKKETQLSTQTVDHEKLQQRRAQKAKEKKKTISYFTATLMNTSYSQGLLGCK